MYAPPAACQGASRRLVWPRQPATLGAAGDPPGIITQCLPLHPFTDGPFWGGNAMWGALAATVASLVIGSILSYALVNVRPNALPADANMPPASSTCLHLPHVPSAAVPLPPRLEGGAFSNFHLSSSLCCSAHSLTCAAGSSALLPAGGAAAAAPGQRGGRLLPHRHERGLLRHFPHVMWRLRSPVKQRLPRPVKQLERRLAGGAAESAAAGVA